jgi:ribosomal protein L37E
MPLTLQCKQCGHKTTGTYADKCFKCGVVDWKLDRSAKSSDYSWVFVLIVVVAIFIGAYSGNWGELDDAGWVHHDEMTTIYSHNWVNGEHKHCSNVNANNDDKPFLMCDDARLANEEGKVFEVRFYGRTYEPKLLSETTFDWDCKRNDTEPMFTCKRVPSPKK